VAVREQARQRLADELLLTDDDPADLGLDRPGAFCEGLGGDRVRTGLVGRGWGRPRVLRE